MSLLVFTTQMSLALPVNLPAPDIRSAFSADDMPAYVQIQGINRFVPTKTTVGLDGMPQDCTQERSSGDKKLDVLTCSIILRRAKFSHARWTDGSPAYGIVRAPVVWVIGSSPSKSELRRAYPTDIEISVNRLPEGADRLVTMEVTFAADENGRVVACSGGRQVPELSRAKSISELVPLACQLLTSQFTAIPAKDASSQPVRSVQSAYVVITTKK